MCESLEEQSCRQREHQDKEARGTEDRGGHFRTNMIKQEVGKGHSGGAGK